MKTLSIDLETYSVVDLPAAGLHKYVESDSFEILLFAYAYDGEDIEVVDLTGTSSQPLDLFTPRGKTVIPQEVLNDLTNPEVLKTAYNAQFEITALNKHLGIELDPYQWECSMVKASMAGYPMGLAKCGSAMGLSKNKLKSGKALIGMFSIPNDLGVRRDPKYYLAEWKKFKEYCARDVEVEREIRNRVSYVHVDRKEYAEDYVINKRGVYVDRELIDSALKAIDRIKKKAFKDLRKITGVDNPNSRNQFKDWLEERLGHPIESIDKEHMIDLYKECGIVGQQAIRTRQKLSLTSLSKYKTAREARCLDGRVRGSLQFYGSRTGRWAGRLLQVQNLKKNKLAALDVAREYARSRDLDLGLIDMTWADPANFLSQLIRTVICAPPGMELSVADFSAIEARIVSWLADEKWRLEVFATHGMIYEASAAKMFKCDISEVDSRMRDRGKVSELSLGYGGALGALSQKGGTAIGLSEEEMVSIVKIWRKSNPAIVNFWYRVDDAVKKAIKTGVSQLYRGLIFRLESKEALSIQLPSARKIYYVRPGIEVDRMGREEITYWGNDSKQNNRWCKIRMWGGKITENIAQAIARDCLEVALHRGAHLPLILHVHDEIVAENQIGDGTLEEMLRIMGEPISWASGLILKGEGFTSNYYKKED